LLVLAGVVEPPVLFDVALQVAARRARRASASFRPRRAPLMPGLIVAEEVVLAG
jgi:hypothetical protein